MYWIFIDWKAKPTWLANGSRKLYTQTLEARQRHSRLHNLHINTIITYFADNFNMMCAKLFLCVQEDKTE